MKTKITLTIHKKLYKWIQILRYNQDINLSKDFEDMIVDHYLTKEEKYRVPILARMRRISREEGEKRGYKPW